MAHHLQVRIHRSFPSLVAFAVLLASILALNSFGQPTLFDSSFRAGAGADGGVNSLVIQTNGGIFVGGHFHTIAEHSHSYLARLNGDGSYDDSLAKGTDGLVLRLLQQPDGRILVAGAFTNLQGVVRKKIGRLLTTGEVDLEFDAGSLLETNYAAITLGLQPDGRVLVATVVEGSTARLLRLQANGSMDESFIQTNLFMGYHIFSILVRSNGSILVGGGFGSAGGHNSPGLALLRSDGSPDTNFNTQFENTSTVFSITEQTNGGLLLGGVFRRAGESNYTALARTTANLEWDAAFSADWFRSNEAEGAVAAVRSVLEQPDGKLVVAGYFRTVGGYWRQHVARLDSQGRVDSCFDPGVGLTTATLGGITLARQGDGRILIGGYFDSVDGYRCGNVARLLPQSDCDVTRVHIGGFSVEGFYVAGTSPPGRNIILQASTNLVDWLEMGWAGGEDYDEPSGSFVSRHVTSPFQPPWFFRVKRTDTKPNEQIERAFPTR